MASSNYIKIFDDTVLKQSILQGYEAQRTNVNLGKFTMGELAFTRDTGRVFVGNITEQQNDKDSRSVDGGILVGNKYLGLIDSKPLGHYNPSNVPLNYAIPNVSNIREGEGTIEETGLFLEGSKFRSDKNGKWPKNSEYIEKYDAYTGDYMFDIFNNALILFDKNITTNENVQPESIWDEEQEKFLDANGVPLEDSTNVTRRTKIEDTSADANKNYPIYGDGYVIIRILEPDGTTIGYKDRHFTEGKPRINDAEDTSWSNWSHNLLELKSVPADILMSSMSTDNFTIQEDKIHLSAIQNGVEGFSGKSMILPRTITFGNNYDPETQTPSQHLTLTFPLNELSQQTRNDFVMAVDKNFNVKIAKPLQEQYTIQLFDGLINPFTGDNMLNISRSTSDGGMLGIGLRASAKLSNNDKGSADPFYTMMSSSYYYYGSAYYSQNGTLEKVEKYDNYYYTEAKNEIKQFDTKDNLSITYLKQPTPICWSTPTSTLAQTATASLEYLIKPFLFCVMKSYSPKMKVYQYDTQGNPIENTGKISDYNERITVLGNNEELDLSKPSSFSIVDGFNIDINDDEPFENMKQFSGISSYSIEYAIIEDENKLNWTQGLVPSQTTDGLYTRYIYNPNSDVDTASTLHQHLRGRLEGNSFYSKIIPTLKALSSSEIPEKYDQQGNVIQSGITEYPSIFALQYDTNRDKWTSCSDSNYINLGDWIGYDVAISKIEISTNKPDNRTFTFFDKNAAPWNRPWELQTSTTTVSDGDLNAYIVTDTTSETIRIYGITNSQLFTDVSSTPYYMILTTVSNNIEEKVIITLEDYISCDSPVIQKKGEHYVLPNISTASNEYIAGVLIYKTVMDELASNPLAPLIPKDDYTLITIEQFCSNYCKKSNNKDIWKVNASKFPNIILNSDDVIGTKGYSFVIAKSTTETVEADEIVKSKDGNHITVEFETQSNYHAGISWTKPSDEEYIPESYRVRVVCNGHAHREWWSSISNLPIEARPTWNDVTYMKQTYSESDGWVDTGNWLSAWDLLAGGEITINEIPIETTSFDTKNFTFKKTHSAGDGYFIPDTVLKSVIIPDHAKSVFLEVHQLSNNAISIYSTMEKMSDTTNLEPYSFPFEITSSTELPTLSRNSTILPTDKILYHKSENGVTIIEVPLYRTKLDNSKAFNLKLVNVPAGNTNDRFLIRLIGYRA